MGRSQELETKKSSIQYDLWTRPTIPWKLDCEGRKPRAVMYDLAVDTVLSSTGSEKTNKGIRVIAIVLCIFAPLAACCVVGCAIASQNSGPTKPIACFSVTTCCQAACIAYIWGVGVFGQNLLEKKYNSIKKLTLVNGCSDEYTVVPLPEITASFQKG